MAIIRNLSAVDIELNDLAGITVEALSDYDLKEESQNDVNNSIDLNTVITTGDIVYLDAAGNQLTAAESINVQDSALTHAIFIQKSGINITNSPHQVLNFISNGTTIADNADGSVSVSIDSDSSIWGNITGTLSNQLDLQTALDNKETANANIQLHIADNTIHFTQAAISITESQISDFGTYEPAFSKNTGFNKNFGTIVGTVSEGNHTHVMTDITDSTWISDITGQSIKNLSDVNSLMVPTNGEVLTYNNTSGKWEAVAPSGGGTSFDRQIVTASTTTSTTSSSYVDLNSMSLVTNNLNETGTYIINFNARMANSASSGGGPGGGGGGQVDYILVVGGVQQTNSKTTMTASSTNPYTTTINWMVSGVASGTTIKVQWKRNSSTGYTYHRRLVIDGVPDSSII